MSERGGAEGADREIEIGGIVNFIFITLIKITEMA